jgi:hypothetical protein
MAQVDSIELLHALTDWAIDNHHPLPSYRPSTQEVTIGGLDDAVIRGVLAGFTEDDIVAATRRAPIRSIQMQIGMPPLGELEALRVYARNLLIMLCQSVREDVTDGADAAQLAGWSDKAAIARLVVNGQASDDDVAILELEAKARGLSETADDLAALHLTKAQELRLARALIDGFESRFNRLVGSALDLSGLSQIYNDLIDQGSDLIEQVTSQ